MLLKDPSVSLDRIHSLEVGRGLDSGVCDGKFKQPASGRRGDDLICSVCWFLW